MPRTTLQARGAQQLGGAERTRPASARRQDSQRHPQRAKRAQRTLLPSGKTSSASAPVQRSSQGSLRRAAAGGQWGVWMSNPPRVRSLSHQPWGVWITPSQSPLTLTSAGQPLRCEPHWPWKFTCSPTPSVRAHRTCGGQRLQQRRRRGPAVVRHAKQRQRDADPGAPAHVPAAQRSAAEQRQVNSALWHQHTCIRAEQVAVVPLPLRPTHKPSAPRPRQDPRQKTRGTHQSAQATMQRAGTPSTQASQMLLGAPNTPDGSSRAVQAKATR